MIRSSQIVDLWAQALDNDPALRDFAMAHYGRTFRIFKGFSMAKKPGREQAPFLALRPMEAETGQDSSYHGHTVWVVVGIEDRRETVDGDIMSMEGMASANVDLAFLVLNCLAAANGDIPLSRIDERMDLDSPPLVIQEFDITVSLPNTLGSWGQNPLGG